MSGSRRPRSALLLPVVLLLAACPGKPPPKPTVPVVSRPAPAPEAVTWRVSKSGLGFRLSDADPEPPQRPKIAPSTPLSAEQTSQLLARLPAFKAPAEKKRFALRGRSRTAPRPGETISTPFPPAVARPGPPPNASTAGAAPAVARYAPEGQVEIAPNLSLTFTEPMVSVTSHGDLASGQAPARLNPQPEGRWRWIGTQTLLFEPKGERFPKATDYRVEVPAGTRAASGRAIDKATRFEFTLPAVKVESFAPQSYKPIDLADIFFARFDQKIDKNAVLSRVELKSHVRGAEPIALRLATADEIEADESVRRSVELAEPDRFIAFRSLAPLPKATRFEIAFKKGTPSAEGPKTTEQDQRFSVHTYGPMTFSADCGWYDGCPPLAVWHLLFTNPIDLSSFDKTLVKIDPPLPNARISASGNKITIQGRSKGRTRYAIQVDTALKDRFGQNLTPPASASIDVDAAEPMLFDEELPMLVLDPSFEPTLSVYSVNRGQLRVKLYSVEPGNWERYLEFRKDWDYDGKLTAPPGKLVATRTIQPKKAVDELVETRIDLTPALASGVGQLIAIVEPPVQKPRKNRRDNSEREWVRAWVQVTQLGLQAFSDPKDVYGWVSRLSDGAPVAGAEVSILPALPAKRASMTGPDGIARVAAGSAGSIALARHGRDLVFLPGGTNSYAARSRSDRLLWFVFDDRRLYKPGERLNVKGWLRVATSGKTGDLERLARAPHTIAFTASDARGSKIAEGKAGVDPDGGFHLSFEVPKNANLGAGTLRLELGGRAASLPGRVHHHGYQVEEFRRPEFEVSAETTEGPHFVGKHAIATVRAVYYAGGSLPDSEVKWRVQADDAFFEPPNRRGFHFGKSRRFSWWRPAEADKQRKADEIWISRTRAGGEHRLRIDFEALEPSYPRKLDLEASVADVNRQSWTARTSIVVHPASVSVGLRPESTLPAAGQNLQIDALVTDLQGRAIAGRSVTITAARIESTWRGDQLEQEPRDPQTCTLTSDGADTGQRCTFATKEGGLHRLSADVADEHGRKSHTALDLWVLGSDSSMEAGVRRDVVDVVPDKTEYKGGDEARLLVRAPFAPAEGVLTLEREGVVELRRFRLEKRVETLTARLDPSWVPGVRASVHLVGSALRENDNGDPDATLPKRPAFARGGTNLELPASERALSITISPKPRQLDPGGTTRIALSVKDARGQAVAGGIVSLAVVDESVLALGGYDLPDPLEIFYGARNPDVMAFEIHDHVVLGKPDLSRMRLEPKKLRARNGGDLTGFGSGEGRLGGSHRAAAPRVTMGAAKRAAPAAQAAARELSRTKVVISEVSLEDRDGNEAEASHKTPFKVRGDFGALAAFLPRIVTDARGSALAKVKLPDSLTRYRVVAVAAANENQFGAAQSDVTARLPLMVRPSAPRFLNYGDKLQLPVVIQNQTAEPVTVDVGMRVANLRLVDPNGQRVTVPAADRVELRFPIAASEAGSARFQVGASGRSKSRSLADAAEIELPVWTPATTEAFATYGVVDKGAIAQPVKMPAGVVKEFGGLEITTSSTALQGLSDALLYIVRYPFECNEQISSRVLSIAALRDVLAAFQAEGLPDPAALKKTIALDVDKLADRQHWSGGWDFWRRDREPHPYISVHVTHALVRAKAKGYRVPDPVMKGAFNYLQNIRFKFPSWWPSEVRRAVEAYALNVRFRSGDADAARARALLAEAGGPSKMDIEPLGWLLPILSKDASSAEQLTAVRRHLDNRVTETAGKAHFVTSYGDSAHVLLHSDRRADGILLESLVDDRPDSDVIPKLVAGLLAHRKRGRWYNTQENVFILLALDRYFQKYEKTTPDFVARAWLGNTFAGEHPFKGRSNDRQHVDIPMSAVAELAPAARPANLVLSKEGAGRLYFRVGMQYAPADLRPPPAEHGFSVSRIYEGVDRPEDVTRDRDGSWRIRAGALVRVRLTMVAPARRYHVALVDPLPAGFEPLNPALATTASIPRDPEDDPGAAAARRGAKGVSSARGPRGRVPWWWSRAWYEHQNLRDERVEAFASLLWDGVYSYTYVARATTPGEFVVPPAKAEEMYDPETFGRSAGDRVIVY